MDFIYVNFDKVYKNMVKLDLTEDMNIRLWFMPTVTVFNIFTEFIKWKLVDSGLKNWNSSCFPASHCIQSIIVFYPAFKR